MQCDDLKEKLLALADEITEGRYNGDDSLLFCVEQDIRDLATQMVGGGKTASSPPQHEGAERLTMERAAVPDGFVVVPRNATDDMLNHAMRWACSDPRIELSQRWHSMATYAAEQFARDGAAAPAAPRSEQGAVLPATPEHRLFGELMAVMHGDGGHYLAEHGAQKAYEDALTKWYATPESECNERKERSDVSAEPVDVRYLARDIHHAICDDGLAPLSSADNHALRETILRVLKHHPTPSVSQETQNVSAASESSFAATSPKGDCGGLREATEAMAHRYLAAQRAYIAEVDRTFGRQVAGALHPDDVIGACMAGLNAAGVATSPTEQEATKEPPPAKPSEGPLLNDGDLETPPEWLRDLARDKTVAAPAQGSPQAAPLAPSVLVTDAEIRAMREARVAARRTAQDEPGYKDYHDTSYAEDRAAGNALLALRSQTEEASSALRGASSPAAAGVVVDEAMVERACIAFYNKPAWEFLSHKTGCKTMMHAALTAALAGQLEQPASSAAITKEGGR